MTRPTVMFFARSVQVQSHPRWQSDAYNSVYVTLTRDEKRQIEAGGHSVAACFEEDFAGLPVADVPNDYLRTSFMAERFLGRFDLPKRLEILGKEISFWRALFDTHRPIGVVNELVAFEISEVMQIEARARGIRYLAQMDCPLEGYFYWIPDPITLSGRNLPDVEPDEQARSLARDYVAAVLEKNFRPYYVRDLARRFAVRPVVAAILKSLIWKWRIATDGNRFRYEDYREEYGKRLEILLNGLTNRYDRIAEIPDDVEVIFYPLHQEPEATLNYMSKFYANQAATIENIMKCLGPKQALVVKEHPVDKGSLLRSKFLDVRNRYSAVYFLPAEIHGRQVLERARRVVTLTSTVGWEAAAIGRDVYVLGEIFYDCLPGVTRIEHWEALRAELAQPPADTVRLTPEAFEDLVARLIAISYPGKPLPAPGWLEPDNSAKIVAAIRHALDT